MAPMEEASLVKGWLKLEGSQSLMSHRGLEGLVTFNGPLILVELARGINIDLLELEELLKLSVHSVHGLLSSIHYGLEQLSCLLE